MTSSQNQPGNDIDTAAAATAAPVDVPGDSS